VVYLFLLPLAAGIKKEKGRGFADHDRRTPPVDIVNSTKINSDESESGFAFAGDRSEIGRELCGNGSPR